MNAQASRMDSDYASDIRTVYIRNWQKREIRRQQMRHLRAWLLGFSLFVVSGLILGIAILVASRF